MVESSFQQELLKNSLLKMWDHLKSCKILVFVESLMYQIWPYFINLTPIHYILHSFISLINHIQHLSDGSKTYVPKAILDDMIESTIDSRYQNIMRTKMWWLMVFSHMRDEDLLM